MTGAFVIMGLLLAVWVVASWVPVRSVKEPRYRVVSSSGEYELREYDPCVIAETSVSGGARKAGNEGFRRLAGYIFGGNVQERNVSMTAPVLSRSAESGRSIPMTAPVLAGKSGEETVLTFFMPAGETLSSLPVPKNAAVKLREVPKRRAAVIRIPLHPTERKVDKGKEELRAALRRDGLGYGPDIDIAYYNPPWTIPFMRRTEIIAWLDGEHGEVAP